MWKSVGHRRQPPFPITELPTDLLEHVLSHLPGQFLIHVAQLVCKHWKAIIDSPSLWKIKCLRGYPLLEVCFKHGHVRMDIKKLYIKNPLLKNLIKNPYALEGLKHWDVVEGYRGDDFSIETCYPNRPPGANVLDVPNWDGKVIKNWATSYQWCEKSQLIDLVAEGCPEFVLDELRPEIDISEWYAGRFDCGCVFNLNVDLLSSKKEVLDNFSVEWTVIQWQGKEWHQVCHTFTGYPLGVRYIKYTHKGKDTQYWAGHYGPKFTGASVKFNLKKCVL